MFNERGNHRFLDFLGNTRTLMVLAVLLIGTAFCLANFILALGMEIVRVFHLQVNGDITGSPLSELSIPWRAFFQPQLDYGTYYAVCMGIAIYGIGRLVYQLKRNFRRLDNGQHGTSVFSTLHEIKKQYKAVPEKNKCYKGKGGVVISRYGRTIYVDDGPVNNLVIGTTRSGKGETFVVPTIDVYSRAEQQPSMVINDPKGELAAASHDTLTARGYDVHVLNLLDPSRSIRFNPLQLIVDAIRRDDVDTAIMLSNQIAYSLYHDANAKDPFWQNSAISLFNALCIAIAIDARKAGNHITLYTIANFLSEKGSSVSSDDGEEDNALDQFFKRRPASDPAKIQYATSNFAKGVTRAGIFATAMSKLHVFTLPANAKMTAGNTLHMEDIGFGKKPVAVFMLTPDYDKSNHVLTSIFVRQLYYVLAKKATSSRGGRTTREVVMMLDEFGNMPPIEGMDTIITVCLGRNIRFNLVVQSYNQIKTKYGNAYETITSNCGNHIYILSNDLATAEHVSKLLGNQTISDVSRSGEYVSLDKKENESTKSRPLLNANELMALKEEESVVIRVIKRHDQKRRKIQSKPIYNTGKMSLKARWRYLADQFDTDKSYVELPNFGAGQHDVTLDDLIFREPPLEKEMYKRLVDVLDPSAIENMCLAVQASVPSVATELEADLTDMSMLQCIAFYRSIREQLDAQSREVLEHILGDYWQHSSTEWPAEPLSEQERIRQTIIGESERRFM